MTIPEFVSCRNLATLCGRNECHFRITSIFGGAFWLFSVRQIDAGVHLRQRYTKAGGRFFQTTFEVVTSENFDLSLARKRWAPRSMKPWRYANVAKTPSGESEAITASRIESWTDSGNDAQGRPDTTTSIASTFSLVMISLSSDAQLLWMLRSAKRSLNFSESDSLSSIAKNLASGRLRSNIFSVNTPVPGPISSMVAALSRAMSDTMVSAKCFELGQIAPISPGFLMKCLNNSIRDIFYLVIVSISDAGAKQKYVFSDAPRGSGLRQPTGLYGSDSKRLNIRKRSI